MCISSTLGVKRNNEVAFHEEIFQTETDSVKKAKTVALEVFNIQTIEKVYPRYILKGKDQCLRRIKWRLEKEWIENNGVFAPFTDFLTADEETEFEKYLENQGKNEELALINEVTYDCSEELMKSTIAACLDYLGNFEESELINICFKWNKYARENFVGCLSAKIFNELIQLYSSIGSGSGRNCLDLGSHVIKIPFWERGKAECELDVQLSEKYPDVCAKASTIRYFIDSEFMDLSLQEKLDTNFAKIEKASWKDEAQHKELVKEFNGDIDEDAFEKGVDPQGYLRFYDWG